MSYEYPDGIDAVWLAVDQAGYVAAFTTGGAGPIPFSALAGMVENPSLEEQIAESMVETTSAHPSTAAVSWRDLARRGFFVFDWQDVHRTFATATNKYELVCSPASPARIEAAPPFVQTIARATLLSGVSFPNATHVSVTP